MASIPTVDTERLDPQYDQDRMDTWGLHLQAVHLHTRSMMELQVMLRQEHVAREALSAKVDKLADNMQEAFTKLAMADARAEELTANFNELSANFNQAVREQRQLQADLAAESAARAALGRTLREEAISQKYDLVRCINQETEARERLQDTVAQHRVELDADAEHVKRINHELGERGTMKALEDCVNECKATTQGGVVRMTKAMEDEHSRAQARHDTLAQRTEGLEAGCASLKQSLQDAVAAHADLRAHVEQGTDGRLNDLTATVERHEAQLEGGARMADVSQAVDRHQTYITGELRNELDDALQNRLALSKSLDGESNTLSTVISRMQAAETMLSAMENRDKAAEADKENFQILMHKAERQTSEFDAMKSKIDGMGMQLNRQGILVQNVKEKLAQTEQHMTTSLRGIEQKMMREGNRENLTVGAPA